MTYTVTFTKHYTPCGWCIRQNKECDIEEARKRKKKYSDLFKTPTMTNKMCQSEEDHQWECCGVSTGESTFRCKVCGKHKSVPIERQNDLTISTYLNSKENTND